MGQLDMELALPPIPAATDTIEIDLIPVKKRVGYDTITATYARIRCSWIDAFPIVHSALRWTTNDWNGEVTYFVNDSESREALGAAFAAELADFDPAGLYSLPQNTLDRLTSYYIEAGLMTEDGEVPFTETGKRVARRHRIWGASKQVVSLVSGAISRKENATGFDDEIPF